MIGKGSNSEYADSVYNATKSIDMREADVKKTSKASFSIITLHKLMCLITKKYCAKNIKGLNMTPGQMKDNRFYMEECMNYKYLLLFKSLKRKWPNLIVFGLVIFLLLITGCQEENKLISYDVHTYLSCNTDFEKKASIVLPSTEDIEDSEIVYFAIYDNSGASFQEGMLRLTVNSLLSLKGIYAQMWNSQAELFL